MQFKFLITALALLVAAPCSEGGRIYNGDDVTDYEKYPFMTYMISTVGGFNYQCGGSIVGSRWILTAAHCVDGASEISLTVGRLNAQDTGSNQQTVAAESWTMHPDYSSSTLANDIALIYLSEELSLDASVRPIALPTDADEAMYDGGAAITVIGWGGTESGSLANQLQELAYELVNFDTCQSFWSGLLPGMVCTASNPPDEQHSWGGDSGGPLFGTNSDGSYTQLALVSWGTADDSVLTYDVNTHVLYYVQSGWIGSVMGTDDNNTDDDSDDDSDNDNTDDGDDDSDNDNDDSGSGDGSDYCQTYFYATAAYQSMYSINHPDDYENNYNCTTIIYCSGDSKIEFKFVNFSMEDGDDDAEPCPYDWVKLQDGMRDDSPPLGDGDGTYCGSMAQGFREVSSGNAIRVVFRSDSSITSSGFHAVFRIYDEDDDDNSDDGDDDDGDDGDNNGDDDGNDELPEVFFTLMGGSDQSRGIVMATTEDSSADQNAENWRAVCNDGAGRNEVNALCNYFGYSTGILISPYHWALDSSILEDVSYGATDISCPAGATDPNDCDWTPYEMASVPCVDGQQVAVSCADKKFEFMIYEGGASVNKKGKAKFECAAYAQAYGMYMDLSDNAEAFVVNRDRNGNYSYVDVDMKYKKKQHSYKGKSWVSDIEEDDRCFICVVWINDSMMFAAAADAGCVHGEMGEEQLKTEIWEMAMEWES